MNVITGDRSSLCRTVAAVAAGVSLLCACGLGPRNEAPQPSPPPLTVSLSASTIAFPDTAVGASSAPQNLTITNVEAVPLRLSIVLSGSSRGQFSLEQNSCPAVLPADQSCTISIAYKPSTQGHFDGLLYIFSPGRGVFSISLPGTALPPMH